MSKRITSAIVLVALLAIAPVAVAAPSDRGGAEGDLAGLVQAAWEDLARFLGIGPAPVEPTGADEPRSLTSQEEGGPTIDP